MTYDFGALPFVREGKTKIVRRSRSDTVDILEKNDMTAGNGKRHELIPGKGKVCAAISARMFRFFEEQRIPTAFVKEVAPGINRMSEGEMFPYEVVGRFVADGSFCKRNPDVPKGTVLPSPVIEFYLKTKGCEFGGIKLPDDDPLIVRKDQEDGIDVVHPALPSGSPEQAASLVHIPAHLVYGAGITHPFEWMSYVTCQAGAVLRDRWNFVDCSLIDFKIEFARLPTGVCVIADSLSPDEMRVRTAEGRLICKEPFRQGASVHEMVELYTEALIRVSQM
jgi:phosphoribosylaminoimidazole-succinocarboxamide synthase